VDVPACCLELIGEAPEEPVEVSQGVQPDGSGPVTKVFDDGELLESLLTANQEVANAGRDRIGLMCPDQGLGSGQERDRLNHR
jgi:hypothetical protein